MKTFHLSAILMAIAFLLVSCVEMETMKTSCITTSTFPSIINDNNNSYNVSISEIHKMDFSRLLSPLTKSENVLSKRITPIVEGVDTLLYIINYDNSRGWILASGDKRMPFILAVGEKGNLDIERASTNNGFVIWLEKIMGVTRYLKKNPDLVPDSTYIKIWEPDICNATKGGGGEHEGEWLQLVYTIIDYSVLHYNIDHFMSTHWGQEEPWNSCLPLYTNGIDRCPAGCAVVAAAQTAYYLHDMIGKPIKAYQYGICNDYYTANSPTITRYNLDSSNWALMPLDSSSATTAGKNAVSALMADIGKRSGASWHPNGTSVSLAGIMNYFSHYGVSCSSGLFDNETILNDILNDKPVIVGLNPCPQNSFGSHTAVIDGMCVYSTRYTYYNQWMPIGTFPPVEPEFPDLEHPELYEIGYGWGSNTQYYYRLNWGFDDGYLDQGYYLYNTQWGIGSFRYEPDVILYNFH